MTQILKGENSLPRDCSLAGLDVTQTRLHVWAGGRGGSFLRTVPRITCTKLCKSPPLWPPEGLKTFATPQMASSQHADLLFSPPHAIISTPPSRHRLPTTAGLGSGHAPFQRRAHSAHSRPASEVSIRPRDWGPSAPPSGSAATALRLHSASEFLTPPQAPQGGRRSAISSKPNNAM